MEKKKIRVLKRLLGKNLIALFYRLSLIHI